MALDAGRTYLAELVDAYNGKPVYAVRPCPASGPPGFAAAPAVALDSKDGKAVLLYDASAALGGAEHVGLLVDAANGKPVYLVDYCTGTTHVCNICSLPSPIFLTLGGIAAACPAYAALGPSISMSWNPAIPDAGGYTPTAGAIPLGGGLLGLPVLICGGIQTSPCPAGGAPPNNLGLQLTISNGVSTVDYMTDGNVCGLQFAFPATTVNCSVGPIVWAGPLSFALGTCGINTFGPATLTW